MMLLIIVIQQIIRTVLQKIVLRRTQHQKIVLQRTVHLRIVLLIVQIMHQIVDKDKKSAAKAVGIFSFYEYNIKKTDFIMDKFKLISMNEAKALALEPDYIVVDLRSRGEYDHSHIENAINIESGTIEDIDAFHRKDLTWVLYCHRGSLSFRLASEMASRGYNVIAVVGGFKE